MVWSIHCTTICPASEASPRNSTVLTCRDLKSLNILLKLCATSSNPGTLRFQVCLGDLGTMSFYERGSAAQLSGFSGTHEYMAPEVLKIQERENFCDLVEALVGMQLHNLGLLDIRYDEKVDIWSALMMLLDMLSGLGCAGLELFNVPIRTLTEKKMALGEFAMHQLNKLANGMYLPLGVINTSNFLYYKPVLERLIPLMAGLSGQQRCSAHSLLPIVTELKKQYENSSTPPLCRVEFCL